MSLAWIAMIFPLWPVFGIAEDRPGKAVYEISRESGMKLSDVALTNIEVALQRVRGAKALVPPSTLVFYQDHVGVYRRRAGWFKLVPVRVVHRTASAVEIETADLNAGDEIVTRGADLLRVSELDATTGDE